MDILHLDTLSFPVRRGEFSCAPDTTTPYRWNVEIHCGPSPQLDYQNWPDNREEQALDWLAGAEPYLYAQMLPLGVETSNALVGREYTFPQSPDDEHPDWPAGIGWPFFCVYLMEHDLVYPVRLKFVERRGRQFRVEIAGSYPLNETVHDLRASAWLDWVGSEPTQVRSA